MKYLVFVVLFSVTITAQAQQRTTIAGNEIETSYDPIKKILKTCIAAANSQYCKTPELDIDSNMMLGAELDKNLKAFFADDKVQYNLFGVELQKADIVNHTFAPDITVDLELLDSTSTAVIALDGALEQHYFKITKEEENPEAPEGEETTYKYFVELNNAALKAIEKAEFKPAKPFAEDKDDFETDLENFIHDELNNAKMALQNEIKEGEDAFIEASTKAMYEAVTMPQEEYEFETKGTFKDADGNEKDLSVYSLFDKTTFTLKITGEDDFAATTTYGPYALDITEDDFVDRVIAQHDSIANTGDNKTELEKVHAVLAQKILTQRQENFEQEIEDTIKSRLDSLVNADKTFSGQIKLEGEIDLYIETKVPRKDKLGNEKTKKYKDSILLKYKNTDVLADVKFKPEYALVRFFNDRLDNIAIVGTLGDDDTQYTLYNRFWSLPIRELLNRKQTNSFVAEDGVQYRYFYQDALKFLPQSHFNYAVKNQEVRIDPDTPHDIEDRSISDYFTGIFFTDALGLNSNNENSFIVAEAQLRFPFHLRNHKIFTFVDHFSAYARFNLFNGFEGGNRRIDLADVVVDDVTAFDESTEAFTTDNFNLFTNSNLDAGLQIVPLTIEWKGAASFIYFRYGLRFLRTGVQYNLSENTVTTNADGTTSNDVTFLEQRNFQVYSTGHEAEINVAIRRQGALIGADVTGGLNWISETGTNRDDVNLVTTNNTPNLKIELNLYAFTNANTSSSGIFARLGMNYNLGNSRGYPQLLVGYATNLSTFVNRLSGDN